MESLKLSNIGLGWMWLAVSNTLAYFSVVLIAMVKRFIVHARSFIILPIITIFSVLYLMKLSINMMSKHVQFP